jgi:hypothetical protein
MPGRGNRNEFRQPFDETQDEGAGYGLVCHLGFFRVCASWRMAGKPPAGG